MVTWSPTTRRGWSSRTAGSGWFARAWTAVERWVLSLSVLGVLGATLLFWQSLSPSLLPRTWVMQGALSGMSALIGYLLGWAVHWVIHWVIQGAARAVGNRPPTRPRTRPRLSDRTTTALRWSLFGAAVVFSLSVFAESAQHQAHNWSSLGVSDPERFLYTGVVAITVVVLVVGILLARLVHGVRSEISRHGERLLPRWVAGAISVAVVGLALVTLVNDVLYKGALSAANESFSFADVSVNDDEPDPPVSPLRTSGPGSEVTWESLGTQGRSFISLGPTAQEITGISGLPALEPIRVFVGVESAGDIEARAALALAELDRTKAFERRAILFNVPTGTGWMNEQNIEPVEFMYDGDTATVGVQYSHLPSPLALLSEQRSAVLTARAVLDLLEERLDGLHAQSRPELFVAGESLGAFGGQGAYSDIDDARAQVDHALWVGTPGFTALRKKAESSREPGSGQMFPLLGDGSDVVFANDAGDLSGTRPKVVFLQNADDPIAWWDPELIVEKPDWIREPLDPAVNPEISYGPMRTFLQISMDMAVGNSF